MGGKWHSTKDCRHEAPASYLQSVDASYFPIKIPVEQDL